MIHFIFAFELGNSAFTLFTVLHSISGRSSKERIFAKIAYWTHNFRLPSVRFDYSDSHLRSKELFARVEKTSFLARVELTKALGHRNGYVVNP